MPLASSAVVTAGLVSAFRTDSDTFPGPAGTALSCFGSRYGRTAGSTTPVPSAATAAAGISCHQRARRAKALPAGLLAGT
jgi:hypothetical protein